MGSPTERTVLIESDKRKCSAEILDSLAVIHFSGSAIHHPRRTGSSFGGIQLCMYKRMWCAASCHTEDSEAVEKMTVRRQDQPVSPRLSTSCVCGTDIPGYGRKTREAYLLGSWKIGEKFHRLTEGDAGCEFCSVVYRRVTTFFTTIK
jgi:hypothetical protein